MARYFDILRFVLPVDVWVPITVAIDCHRIVVQNSDAVNAISFRVEEGGSEKPIPASLELDIDAREMTFLKDSIVGYCKATTAGAAVVTYTR